jgi:prefoldin subunit 5
MGATNEEVEELVESIIDEKWDELAKDVNKIVEWKNDVETRIVKMDQRFESLKDEFDKLHQAIIGKIGDYDKNILEVGAELKAMEKVFSKVLPLFTENVNELSRITQDMKKKTTP